MSDPFNLIRGALDGCDSDEYERAQKALDGIETVVNAARAVAENVQTLEDSWAWGVTDADYALLKSVRALDQQLKT